MVSKIRQMRKDRQKKHIPSLKAWDVRTNSWIDNPELKDIIVIQEEKEVAVTPKSTG